MPLLLAVVGADQSLFYCVLSLLSFGARFEEVSAGEPERVRVRELLMLPLGLH